jgi:hypothetical protein
VPRLLAELGWKFYDLSPTTYKASRSIRFWSWGEEITIDFSRPGRVLVESKCSFPLQCFDWGWNRGNVNLVIWGLEDRLGGGMGCRPGRGRSFNRR